MSKKDQHHALCSSGTDKLATEEVRSVMVLFYRSAFRAALSHYAKSGSAYKVVTCDWPKDTFQFKDMPYLQIIRNTKIFML
jgi:hypothetical protein